mgnify:CR=1 FL=1
MAQVGPSATVEQVAAHEQLGLGRQELHALLDSLSEDLQSGGLLQGGDLSPIEVVQNLPRMTSGKPLAIKNFVQGPVRPV